MAYLQMSILSQSLMRTVSVNVILPVDKLVFPGMPQREEKPYKTLYLLHGMFGSYVDWVNGTNIQRWAEEKNLVVVMPESWCRKRQTCRNCISPAGSRILCF